MSSNDVKEKVNADAKKSSHGILKFLAVIGAAALAVALLFAGKGIKDVIDPAPQPTIDVVEVRRKLEKIDELGTASLTYSDVKMPDSKYRKLLNTDINIPFTKHQLGMVKYDGCIKAGYDDVSDIIDSASVNNDDKTITIKLPQAKILSNELDAQYYEETEKNNILNPLDPNEYEDVTKQLKKEQREKAINEDHIYDLAEESAEETITNVLSNFEGYSVHFE